MNALRYFACVIAAVLLTCSSASAQDSVDHLRRKAMQKDYQAQRNLAFCLGTADEFCNGIVVPKPIEACAWRMIIIGSGNRQVDQSDVSNYRRDCYSNISAQERSVALTQAEALFKKIYRKELPLGTLLR